MQIQSNLNIHAHYCVVSCCLALNRLHLVCYGVFIQSGVSSRILQVPIHRSMYLPILSHSSKRFVYSGKTCAHVSIRRPQQLPLQKASEDSLQLPLQVLLRKLKQGTLKLKIECSRSRRSRSRRLVCSKGSAGDAEARKCTPESS